MAVGNSTNRFATANFIVAPTIAEGAEYTTIASALAVAVSGDTIFLKPGTYTEDITLKAGVNITAFTCDAFVREGNVTPNVVILGKATATFAGSCALSGVCLQTNGDYCLSITGSALTKVQLINCYVRAADNDAIQFSSSVGAKLSLFSCLGDFATTGIRFFAHSSAGSIKVSNCLLGNNAVSTTDSTISSGGVSFLNSFIAFGITTSSTGGLELNNSSINQNLTLDGSGSHTIFNTNIIGGTDPGITIGASSTVTIATCNINSTNTNAITGAGALIYAGLTFSNTGSAVNVTTQTVRGEGPNRILSGTGHLTLPLGTTGERPGTPAEGMVRGNSTTNNLEYYDGSAWLATSSTLTGVLTGNGTSAFTASAVTDNTVVMGSTSNLLQNTTITVTDAGEMVNASQPSFFAYLPSTDLNKTGNGGVFTLGSATALTEVFDQGGDFVTTGTFTAPVTGKYYLRMSGYCQGNTASTQLVSTIVTSNRTLIETFIHAASGENIASMNAGLLDMDASDTATFTLTVYGNAGDTVDIFGNASGNYSSVAGHLVC